MQSDDTFRRGFEAAIADLASWADQQHDAAHIECESERDFWRVRLEPLVANACPAELILHRPTQRFDVQIGAEAWADLEIERLDGFRPMLEAIVAGCVVTRSWLSASSGSLLSTETEISQANVAFWRQSRTTPLGARLPAAEQYARVKHWVAYRRT